MSRGLIVFTVAFVAAMGLLIVFPAIDLAASGLFYRPGDGFFLAQAPTLVFIRKAMPYLVAALAAGGVALLFVPGRRMAGIFLLAALVVGPGLVVNTVFKDHWGRARPAQIVQFGGDKHYTVALAPSDQCAANCSFPAGDPAVGFYLVAIALLLPAASRARRGTMAGAFALGALLGLVRIAQGGHFLSDVVASGFIIFGVSWALYRLLIAWDGLGALAQAFRHPSRGLIGFVVLTIVTAVVMALSIAFIDEPLARLMHDNGDSVLRIGRFVTRFGVSTAYLIVSAMLAVGLHGAAWRATDKQRHAWLRFQGWRATSVFLAVAISGLIADLLKPVIGRARPKMLFAGEAYGFTWFGPRADYWSFPSGHSVTAAALAFALSVLYPKGAPAFILAALLIALSRILLDAHYLSDVIGGLYIGVVTAWALYAAMKSNGIRLAQR
ncbi:MAG TPA: phosphatase PAP2 family protein [Stellaceae bacterium]|nr:phosphatase PAP2 family protein [Stellaceae bacterium]